MKLAICNEIFKGWPLEETFDYISKVGYQGVELAPFTLARSVYDISPEERDRIRRLAEGCSLEVVGLHWLFASPPGLHVTGRDEETRAKTIDYLQELIRFCDDVTPPFTSEGGRLVIGSPKQRNVEEGVPYEEARRRFCHMLGSSAELARERGITLCVEPLSRDQTNFITTMSEAIEIVEEIAHPNVKAMFDVHNLRDAGVPLADLLRGNLAHIAHFHANEIDGNAPGTGETDFRLLFKVLEEGGYNGFISVEVFDFSPGPKCIAEASYRYLMEAMREVKA